jgi:hypothetical protein
MLGGPQSQCNCNLFQIQSDPNTGEKITEWQRETFWILLGIELWSYSPESLSVLPELSWFTILMTNSQNLDSYIHKIIKYNNCTYRIFACQSSETKKIGETDYKHIQEVLGRTNRLLSMTRHGPHWKLCVQQFFYCCACICYRSNVSTEPLPSNDRGDTHTHTQMDSNVLS